MEDLQDRIIYSDRYHDDEYEYRHVILPKELACKVPKDRLMSEAEWRALGVQQSLGWVHYWYAAFFAVLLLVFVYCHPCCVRYSIFISRPHPFPFSS